MKPKLLALIIVTIFSCCTNPSAKKSFVAKQIKLHNLKSELENLANGKTEFDFLGIHSNGTDCIYFIIEKNKYNIEFEAMIENQIPYIKKLNDFANARKLKTKITTYENKAHYESDKPAPVLVIEANMNIDEIVLLAQTIQKTIFANNEETVYQVVP